MFFFIFFHFFEVLKKESETKIIAKTKIVKAKTIENKEAKIIANGEVSKNKCIELVFCI